MSDVTRDITLPVDPDEAWEALLEPGWLGEEAQVDAREGGSARFVVDGERRDAIVEEAVPGERLVFWWWTADAARRAGHGGQPRGIRARRRSRTARA